MRPRLRDPICRNCGELRPSEELDDQRWCTSCRQRVIPRSAMWARGIALIFTLLVGIWIAAAIRPTRFLVIWMVILAMTYVVVQKISQRVAFEVIRARDASAAKKSDE